MTGQSKEVENKIDVTLCANSKVKRCTVQSKIEISDYKLPIRIHFSFSQAFLPFPHRGTGTSRVGEGRRDTAGE